MQHIRDDDDDFNVDMSEHSEYHDDDVEESDNGRFTID
jgi:hypothetical protein